MFSDYVGIIAHLLNRPPQTYLPLLPLAVIVFSLGRFLAPHVLRGHSFVLAIAGFAAYALAYQCWSDGQYLLSLLFVVPLGLVGREGYRRLSS